MYLSRLLGAARDEDIRQCLSQRSEAIVGATSMDPSGASGVRRFLSLKLLGAVIASLSIVAGSAIAGLNVAPHAIQLRSASIQIASSTNKTTSRGRSTGSSTSLGASTSSSASVLGQANTASSTKPTSDSGPSSGSSVGGATGSPPAPATIVAPVGHLPFDCLGQDGQTQHFLKRCLKGPGGSKHGVAHPELAGTAVLGGSSAGGSGK